MKEDIIISVTDANNTYTARAQGQTSTCTSGAFEAAGRLACKLLDAKLSELRIVRLEDIQRKQRYAAKKLERKKP